jgi:hypothetical protein
MNDGEHVHAWHDHRDWVVRLDCGHDVAVPRGAAVPFVMACLVRHPELCDARHAEPVERASWVPSLATGVASH